MPDGLQGLWGLEGLQTEGPAVWRVLVSVSLLGNVPELYGFLQLDRLKGIG